MQPYGTVYPHWSYMANYLAKQGIRPEWIRKYDVLKQCAKVNVETAEKTNNEKEFGLFLKQLEKALDRNEVYRPQLKDKGNK